MGDQEKNAGAERPTKWRSFPIDKKLAMVAAVVTIITGAVALFRSGGKAVDVDNGSIGAVTQQVKGDGNEVILQVIQVPENWGTVNQVIDAQGNMGTVNVFAGDYIEAASGQELDYQDKSVIDRIDYANELLTDGRYADVVTMITATLNDPQLMNSAKDTERSALYYTRGLAYLQQGDYPSAKSDFMMANDIYARPEAHYNLGVIDFNEKNYDSALAEFNLALNSGENALYLLARAVTYEMLGRESEALDDYEAVLRLDPSSEQAAQGRARVQLSGQDHTISE